MLVFLFEKRSRKLPERAEAWAGGGMDQPRESIDQPGIVSSWIVSVRVSRGGRLGGRGRSEVEVPGCLLQGEKGKKRDPEDSRPITGRELCAAIGRTRVSLRLRELIESRVINIVDGILGNVEVYGVGREWNGRLHLRGVYIVGLKVPNRKCAAIDLPCSIQCSYEPQPRSRSVWPRKQ